MLSMKFPHLFLRPEIIITFLWGWEWSGAGAGATPLSAEFWLVCMLMMTCCIVGLGTSLLLLILPCICPIFYSSILSRMKFFVKDFSRTVQARVLIFGVQVDDDLLYRGIEN